MEDEPFRRREFLGVLGANRRCRGDSGRAWRKPIAAVQPRPA